MENNNCKHDWKSPWLALVIIGMFLISGILVLSLLRERFVDQNQWTVSFTGQGKVIYEPDVAKIDLGVKVDKKEKAEDALIELNQKIKKIISAIEKVGIEKGDIQTQSYTLTPNYDTVDDVRKLAGYDANQIIIVKVRNINDQSDRPSEIIKAASKAGVNQINNISFEPSDIERLKQEARIKAIVDAKKKASDLSGKIGIELDKIIGWWESYEPYAASPYYGRGGIGGGGEASVPSGYKEIIVDVSISYLVK